jgi:hypothetical protein
MKKIALLIMILPLFALGQTYKSATHNNNLNVAPSIRVPLNITADIAPSPLLITNSKEAPEYKKITSRGSMYTPVEIGNSQYGLQTNSSVARRIVVYADGKQSAVWTTSKDQTPYQTRGTGYNHYNGSAWFHSVQSRLEVTRAGWPNIGKVNKNGTDIEYVMSHYASSVSTDPSGGIVINTNPGIGQITWQQTFLDQASGPIWHRTAECGDNVCIISTYSDTGKYVNGMQTPTVYSRYKVSTGTFDQKYAMLPGYDTSLHKAGGSADDYAIDANGKTVAIVIAPWKGHVTLWKSVDSGVTFTRTIIDSFVMPKPKFENDTQYYDYSDGSVSVIVDNEGYCKVVWSYFIGFKYTNTNDSAWYRPYEHGLYYWNEKTGVKSNIPSAKVWDRNGNGLLDVYNGMFATRVVSGGRYYYTRYGSTNNLLSFPQLTIDNAGNIFVIYSAIVEGAFFFTDFNDAGDSIKENLRDVYVVYSKDQGLTWGNAQNITNNPLMEDAFASVAKNCYGDKLHILFQEDEDPGTDVQNYDPATVNYEYYVEVPISDILSDLIGPGDSLAKVGINDLANSFKIGNNYPNPFSGETFIDIQLNNNSNVVVTMNNMLGQQVLENKYTNVPSGNRTLSIDASGLQAGIYFLNVKVGNNVKTVKTVIQ